MAAEERQLGDAWPRAASPPPSASSHSAVESHPVEAVPDVLLAVHSHLAQPDHPALGDILLQLTLHQRHQPWLLAGLRPPQQHIAGMTASLEQRGCNAEQREKPSLRSLCSDWPPDPTPHTHGVQEVPAAQCPPAPPRWRAGRRRLTTERNYLVCAIAELQQDISVGRMEKIQLLERSSGSLQPTGHYQDTDPHVIPETTPAPGSAITHARQNTSSQILVHVCPTHPV